MTGKRTGERLDKLDTGALIARCADLPEGAARLAVLDELARRGEAWAAGLAEFEREQAASDRLARRHFTDLPEVRASHADPAEAIEAIPGDDPPLRLDRPGMWIPRAKATPCEVPPPSNSRRT